MTDLNKNDHLFSFWQFYSLIVFLTFIIYYNITFCSIFWVKLVLLILNWEKIDDYDHLISIKWAKSPINNYYQRRELGSGILYSTRKVGWCGRLPYHCKSAAVRLSSERNYSFKYSLVMFSLDWNWVLFFFSKCLSIEKFTLAGWVN